MAEATMTERNSAHSKPPVRDTGHLRTSSLDELQAEDRQSRPVADIRIEFLEAMTGEKLPQWQREIAERLLKGPPYQMIVHRRLGRMSRLEPLPPRKEGPIADAL
jgi:hypothetical protein